MSVHEVPLPRLVRRAAAGAPVQVTALTVVAGEPIAADVRPGDLVRFTLSVEGYSTERRSFRGVVLTVDPPADGPPARAWIEWMAPYPRSAAGEPMRCSDVAVPALVVIRRAS